MGLFLGGLAGYLLIGVPIAMALGMAAFTYLLVTGSVSMMMIFPQRMLGSVNQFVLLTIPLFLLAGNLMNHGGITQRILTFANACVGHRKGGLSLVNVVSSMFFGGVSGAAAADTSALGTILIPGMTRSGYPVDYAAGLTAVSSVVGSIIPPSIIMVLYGVLTGTSIAQLFLAGVVPGIMVGLSLLVYAAWVADRRGYPVAERMSMPERFASFVQAFPVLLLPFIILGGILLGVFTPTESAAVAVIYALILSAAYRSLSLRNLIDALSTTAIMTAGIMFIVSMASIVQFILSFERIPAEVTQVILGLTDNPTLLVLLIVGFLLLLGMFLEPIAAMIISLPVLFEVAQVINLDPIHFGMIVVLTLAIGLATPPVGICLFIACAIANISLEQISRVALPMIGVVLIVLLLVTFVPALSTALPSIMLPR
ncbi:TRAP transporter large permease [Rhodoligotrophos defluvii]|uniref:TRAP transporter large permease n=1 Tax=Rhodoligotrophos defluvii TaxID=2561934 RepID=UPI0010C9DA5C|nr:TRAP transporter large permease [Rhodoligotrophos defluvii]